MQAIMEPIFHISYLTTVVFIGLTMIRKSNGNDYYKWFGIMAVTLGFGDAFHLIPRIIALLTTGFEDHAVSLGFGKFVTSITMTIFYLILYTLWKKRYSISNVSKLDITMWTLATVRIVLCFFPPKSMVCLRIINCMGDLPQYPICNYGHYNDRASLQKRCSTS
jgi:hypothetical protein